MLWQWRIINHISVFLFIKHFFCFFECMWYYINVCRYANVLYSPRAQSLLHLVHLRREERKPVSFFCGFESVYIKAVWGVSVETLRTAASYASSKGANDVWYHALSTLLHLQQTLCTEQRRCKVSNVPLKWKPLALLCWQPEEGLRIEFQSVNILNTNPDFVSETHLFHEPLLLITSSKLL